MRTLLAEVVGDRDHALVVEEIGGGPGEELSVGAVVDACLTPPFLVDRRVVVVREAGRLLTADVPRLVEVVKDPLPSTVLVLVGGGGTVPAPLVKAVNAAGRIIDVTTSKAGDRKAWLHEHLRGAPVKLEPAAADLLAGHVGEDLGRVEGLLGALSAAYGEGARISAEELAPYLGEAGNVPRYELTDAIDKGDPGRALLVLHRMLDAGGLVPVQVLATLHGHFANMLALDGDDVGGERDAAARARHRARSWPRRRSSSRAGWGAPGSPRPSTSSPRPTSTCAGRAASTPRSWSRSWWPGWPARRVRPARRASAAPAG